MKLKCTTFKLDKNKFPFSHAAMFETIAIFKAYSEIDIH